MKKSNDLLIPVKTNIKISFGQKGENWFGGIMGKYYEADNVTVFKNTNSWNNNFRKDMKMYDRKLKSYKSFSINWKEVNKKPYLYPVPYMTIYPGQKQKLTLKIEIEELPKKLEIKHLKKSADKKKYFSFNNEQITKKKGKYTLSNYLEITCVNSFNTDQTIEVLADDVVCGKLKILANDSSHQKNGNVLFIKVTSSAGAGSTSGEDDRLKKYMKQAYINVNIRNLNLNLSSDSNFIPKLRSNSGIHQYLDNKLRTTKFSDGSLVGTRYDNFYRVYFISEVITLSDGSYLLGQAENIPSKTVFVLNLKATATAAGVSFESVKTTATHELLHAIGLFHTFDNNSPLTFKKFETDNIMDYYSQTTAIIAKQTYKWQWEVLKSKI